MLTSSASFPSRHTAGDQLLLLLLLQSLPHECRRNVLLHHRPLAMEVLCPMTVSLWIHPQPAAPAFVSASWLCIYLTCNVDLQHIYRRSAVGLI